MSMMNLPKVEQATQALLDQGIRVFNAFLFAESERCHVNRLMEFMRLPADGVVLDVGCGVGETARLMAAARPDLQFQLLNVSPMQLASCPEDMTRVLGDFNDLPLPSASVDVVMFHYSICHASDIERVLREARRVLREGGSLFINDMSREYPSDITPAMQSVLGAVAHVRADLEGAAKRAGLTLDEVYRHEAVVNRLESLMDPALYALLLSDVSATTWRFTRQTETDPVASAFARHERVGFQFSGGRDSTAALYLLRDYWPRMTIYHLDTGDQFPETQEVVRLVEAEAGPMTRIVTDVKKSRVDFGLATDLVPVDNTQVGRLLSGRAAKLVSRYDCCAKNLMLPMHQRILDDGITLLIRGQRDDEYVKQPMRSGDVEGGLEVLYPIQDWSGALVSSYLKENGHPIAAFYERGARRAPECMGCTAWWDEGRAQYMRDHHPEAYKDYAKNMKMIRLEIDRQYAMLDD